MGTPHTMKKENTTTDGMDMPKIQVTNIYGLFKLMKGNRTIDYNHVKRLKREIEANPRLLPNNPILVNENYYIVDGQHRHHAAQELGVPVYYIMSQGASIQDTRHLNSTQKGWQLLDFAQSYADSGREDYKTFIEINAKYPNIAPGIIRHYLGNGYKNESIEDFRRGEFRVGDLELAKKGLDRLSEICVTTGVKINMPMANAFWQLLIRGIR